MSDCRLSLITVSYNAQKTIARTMQSVQAQDYPAVEHIVIDGGSQDETLSLIRAHATAQTEWHSEPDNGIYDAMNKGLALATGEIVGFLNADDCFAHQQVLSRVAACFKDPKMDACYGDLVYFTPNNPHKIMRYWRSKPFRPGLFAKGWCPPHPTFYARKTVYERYGGFNLDYQMGNDVELMMRFLEKYRINSQYVPDVWVNMQLGGVSNQSMRHILIQNLEILKAAKALAVPIAPIPYWTYKCIDRLLQFVRLPDRRAYHGA